MDKRRSCETVDSNLHLRYYSRRTLISMPGVPHRYVKVGSRPWFDSAPKALGALANLFQCRFKSSQLFRARIGKDLSNFDGMFPKDWLDQSLPFGVSDTTRTRRSSGLSTRLTRPLSTRRSTAVLSAQPDNREAP
jgi:hypothetical protein